MLTTTVQTILSIESDSNKADKEVVNINKRRAAVLADAMSGTTTIEDKLIAGKALAAVIAEAVLAITHTDGKTQKRLRENVKRSYKRVFKGDKNSEVQLALEFAFFKSGSFSVDVTEYKAPAKRPCADCQAKDEELLDLQEQLLAATSALTEANDMIQAQAQVITTVQDMAKKRTVKVADLKKAING